MVFFLGTFEHNDKRNNDHTWKIYFQNEKFRLSIQKYDDEH